MVELNDLKAALRPVALLLKENATYTDCHRCCGKGEISAFRHVRGGVCFRCGGTQRTASNAAARNLSKLNTLYSSIRQSWRWGVKDFSKSREYKGILELLEKLPKKYSSICGELPYSHAEAA